MNHYHYYYYYCCHRLDVSYCHLFYQCFTFFIIFINFKDFCDADQCRKLEFTPEKAFDGRRLINHVIRIVEVLTMNFCENTCYMEPDCVSINLDKRVSEHGEYKCELNNVTHERHEHDLKKEDNHFYHAAEVGVALLANTHFKGKKKNYEKKKPVMSVAIVALILISRPIFISVELSLLLV